MLRTYLRVLLRSVCRLRKGMEICCGGQRPASPSHHLLQANLTSVLGGFFSPCTLPGKHERVLWQALGRSAHLIKARQDVTSECLPIFEDIEVMFHSYWKSFAASKNIKKYGSDYLKPGRSLST